MPVVKGEFESVSEGYPKCSNNSNDHGVWIENKQPNKSNRTSKSFKPSEW